MHNINTSPIPSESKQAITWHPNRSYIQLSTSIIIDSCFPGGNIATAAITVPSPLTIELQGNTDISMDSTAKYWIYFRIRGYRKDRPVKFVLRNANHLRKYLGQSRVKPYMVYREEGEDNWQPLNTPIELYFADNAQIQGTFTFQSDKFLRDRKANMSTNDLHRGEKVASTTATEQSKRGSCYFAMYYPYNYDDLTIFLQGIKSSYGQGNVQGGAYFNQQTIVYSFQRRKIPMLTITSHHNVESYSEKEPCLSQEIFPHPKDRPFRLKNCPVIFLTARVHPSQTSSSYFIEGLVTFLLGETRAAAVLRQLFIFQIIPMLNPDGAQHGNFRFDHELRNLNRYYGQASIQKTPAIRAAEIMLNYYKNPQDQCKFTQFYQQSYPRLFFYADVHGHSSSLPSFIYGNHTDRLDHAIQNKVFCKILQQNFIPNGFSKAQSEFSKKNMTSQEKYDQFSKLCSGRVFAGRAETPQQKVFHSYTIEVLPYWEQFARKRNQAKDKINAMDYARLLGKAFAISILDMLDLNPQSKFSEAELQKLRRHVQRECINEQSRKLLTFKRAESCNEQASHSDSVKGKTTLDRSGNYYKQYITRWFSNQNYLRNLTAKQELTKEPKVARFIQIVQNFKNGPSQTTESPRKPQQQQQRQCGSKAITEPRQPARDPPSCLKQRMIFVCRKQRGKVQSRINKQTLQLQHDFLDLIPMHQRNPNHQIQMDFATFKKESLPKRQATSTDRYQHELLSTIAHQQQRRLALQVRIKQILPKRNNSRTQTQTIASQPVLVECPSAVPHSFTRKQRERSTPARDCARPSFIQEFMLKIREERQSANVFLQKYDMPDQLRSGKPFCRGSIRDQLEDQQRKLLPILRRNKIFTIVSDDKPEEPIQGKAFESLLGHRRGREDVDEAVLKTKKILIAQKKEEIIRDQLMKKSQKMSQYKS